MSIDFMAHYLIAVTFSAFSRLEIPENWCIIPRMMNRKLAAEGYGLNHFNSSAS